jgi:hypothetical protein
VVPVRLLHAAQAFVDPGRSRGAVYCGPEAPPGHIRRGACAAALTHEDRCAFEKPSPPPLGTRFCPPPRLK